MLKSVEQTFEIAGDDMLQLIGPICELLIQIITNPQCTEGLKKISVQLFEIMCGAKGAKRTFKAQILAFVQQYLFPLLAPTDA